MTTTRYRMTCAAGGKEVTGTCVATLAERLAEGPNARYQGAVPRSDGEVARGLLTWGPRSRPGGARRAMAAVTLERVA
jgi:hypothetical protein